METTLKRWSSASWNLSSRPEASKPEEHWIRFCLWIIAKRRKLWSPARLGITPWLWPMLLVFCKELVTWLTFRTKYQHRSLCQLQLQRPRLVCWRRWSKVPMYLWNSSAKNASTVSMKQWGLLKKSEQRTFLPTTTFKSWAAKELLVPRFLSNWSSTTWGNWMPSSWLLVEVVSSLVSPHM